jgi:hypothetical protein
MNQFPPASQVASPVSTTTAANFATSFASVVDTGGKFATGGKIVTRVVDTWAVEVFHKLTFHSKTRRQCDFCLYILRLILAKSCQELFLVLLLYEKVGH